MQSPTVSKDLVRPTEAGDLDLSVVDFLVGPTLVMVVSAMLPVRVHPRITRAMRKVLKEGLQGVRKVR